MLCCFKTSHKQQERLDTLPISPHTRTAKFANTTRVSDKQAYSEVEDAYTCPKSWLLVDDTGELSPQEVELSVAATHFEVSERDLSLAGSPDGLRFCPVRITARGLAWFVCLEGLRLVVNTRQALLFTVPGDSLLQPRSPFSDIPSVRDLVSRLRISSYSGKPEEYVDKSLPFEFIVLEWALSLASRLLTEEALKLEELALPVLDDLARKVSHKNIIRLRHVKFDLSDLTARMERFRLEIRAVLEDVARCHSIPLSRRSKQDSSPGRSQKHVRRRNKHKSFVLDPDKAAECTSLLECYLIQVEAALNAVKNVQSTSGGPEATMRMSMKLHRFRLGRF